MYSNILIKILSIFGGIIGSLFFVGFLAVADLLESDSVVLVLGIILIVGSLLTGRMVKNLVLDTLIICFYLLGIGMISLALYEMYENGNILSVAILLAGILALIISQRFVTVFLGTMFAYGSLFGFIYANDQGNSIAIVVITIGMILLLMSFYEAAIISAGKKLNILFKPVRSASFISFIAGIVLTVDFPAGNMSTYIPWILPTAIWAGIFILIYRIISNLGNVSPKKQFVIYLFAASLAVPLFFAPYVSGALLLLLLNWHLGYRVEFIMSLAFLTYGLSRYYYDLRVTLLEKSGILFLSGLLLLVLWFFIRKQFKPDEKI